MAARSRPTRCSWPPARCPRPSGWPVAVSGPVRFPPMTAGTRALPGVYAAGDAACFPDALPRRASAHPALGGRRQAGHGGGPRDRRTRPSEPAPPMFWSDQHGRRIQLVGHAPSECEIELDGDPERGGPFDRWISAGRRCRRCRSLAGSAARTPWPRCSSAGRMLWAGRARWTQMPRGAPQRAAEQKLDRVAGAHCNRQTPRQNRGKTNDISFP